MSTPPAGRLRLLALAAGLLVLVSDRVTKALVEPYLLAQHPSSVEVLGDAIRLTYVRNTGIVFGLFAHSGFAYRRELLALLSLGAIVALAVYFARIAPSRRALLFGVALVLGGAVSNVVDRILYGYVIDFIDVSLYFFRWHVFNIADAAIVAGVGLMAIDLMAAPEPDDSPDDARETAAGGGPLMHPVFASFGSVTLFTYGVFLVLASAAAVAWAAGAAERLAGIPRARTVEGATLVLGVGLLASKLALVAQEGGSSFAGTGGVARFARSGGVLHAGLLGGLVAALAYARLFRLPLLPTLDAVAAAPPLGIAIGRLGCWCAGCCWGAPTLLPWGVVYSEPLAHGLAGTPLGVAVHPAPLYAAAAELLTFLAVRALSRREVGTGLALGGLLAMEGSTRLILDPFRGDPRGSFGPVNGGQALALALVLAGLALLFWRLVRRRAAARALPGTSA